MESREARIISGRGRYADDIELPNMAYCVFLGSPYAHARIKEIHVENALKQPGVLSIITGKDLVDLANPLPVLADRDAPGWSWQIPQIYALAVDTVRFQGEPIAAIIAEDCYTAMGATGLIQLELEPLPAVVDAIEAMKPESPLVYEDWKNNVQVHKEFSFGDVDGAFREANRILKASWREDRVSGFPIEPRGCVAWYDRVTETLTAWGTFQAPFRAQQYFSHVLRIPTSRIKVNAVDIGGAFGNKLNSWKQSVVCFASMMIGRPVKWFENQREFITTGPHQRDVIWEGDVAVKNDGRILGIKARFIQDLGVEISNRGYGVGSLAAACCSLPNAYRLKGAKIDVYGVVTNKSFYGAYRGYGKDKGIKFMERIVDLVSKECHLPPHEVRLRNFIQPNEFPYEQISGYVYDSGNYPAVLKKSLELAKLDSWREKQGRLRKEKRYIGIGNAFVIEPAGVASGSSSGLTQARARLIPEGLVEIYSDRTEIGQGVERSHAIVVSNILGMNIDDIAVQPVSSDMVGTGPVSSRGSVYSLSALAIAAKKLREKLQKCAAIFLDEDVEEIVMERGLIYSSNDPERKMTFRELAERIYFRPGPRALPSGVRLGHDFLPDVTATWFSPNTAQNPASAYTTFCCSSDIAVVEVDIETGETKILTYVHVHDAGKIVDREIVDGQIHGGIAQGIGEALYESLIYNEHGELLSNSYTDYLLPTALDVPDIMVEHLETPSPFTELGTKGMGEAPTIGSKAAIISAIEDALSPFRVRITDSPVTKERVRKWVLEFGKDR